MNRARCFFGKYCSTATIIIGPEPVLAAARVIMSPYVDLLRSINPIRRANLCLSQRDFIHGDEKYKNKFGGVKRDVMRAKVER